MKTTNKGADGTSFHGHTIDATVLELLTALGEPTYSDNSGTDKVNYEWIMETNKGDVFTVYDWKEYMPLRDHEVITWHIGGRREYHTLDAQTELLASLVKS